MNKIVAPEQSPQTNPGASEFPTVAVVIPTRNEARTIRQCLESIMHQDYPQERIELLVVDANSTDRTRAIVLDHAIHGTRIRLLDNPVLTTSAAVNLASRSTSAEAILWLSGHCVLSSDYVTQSVRAFMESRDRVTGGHLEVRGEGIRGELNAMVLSSRFGTGASPHRFGRRLGPTESLTYSLFRRQTLIDIGGLDESLARNQDNDLIGRLRDRGTVFWRVDARATYLAPATLTGLWNRAFLNGAWSIWGQRRGRGGHSWWNFAPMAMVGLGITLLILTIIGVQVAGWSLAVLTAIYTSLAIWSAVIVATRQHAYWAGPFLPTLFFMHHVIYGLGSWSALVRPNPVTVLKST